MKLPTISVIMATYNHADFVAQAIESVLGQIGVDFEFLIADDGSVDRTRDIISSFHDERISFFPNEVNRGACLVTNELIQRASGEFIALINSDDYWTDDSKLSYQLQVLRENPAVGACFGRAKFVDKEGIEIDKSALPFGSVFDQQNRSQGQWLRRFFDLGNCICHPTILIRKSCYQELGDYDNRLRQLPDFHMWVRLIKRYNIFVSDRTFIAFRQLPGENASAGTADNMTRLHNESYFVLRDFFDDISQSVFLDGFGDLFRGNGIATPEVIEIEKAFIYFTGERWASHVYNLIGLEKLYDLSGKQPYKKYLVDNFDFNDCDLYALAAKVGTFDLVKSNNGLTSVQGKLLLAEVTKRCVRRSPVWLRPILTRIFWRYMEGV